MPTGLLAWLEADFPHIDRSDIPVSQNRCQELLPLNCLAHGSVIRGGRARMQIEGLCRSELEREHRNVVFLAKGLRDIGDLLRRLPADGPCALKTEELAGRRLGFDHSVGEKGEGVTGNKPKIAIKAIRKASPPARSTCRPISANGLPAKRNRDSKYLAGSSGGQPQSSTYSALSGPNVCGFP